MNGIGNAYRIAWFHIQEHIFDTKGCNDDIEIETDHTRGAGCILFERDPRLYRGLYGRANIAIGDRRRHG